MPAPHPSSSHWAVPKAPLHPTIADLDLQGLASDVELADAIAAASGTTEAPLELDNTAGTDTIISGKRTADSDVRWNIDADGKITWEDGAGTALVSLSSSSADILSVSSGPVKLGLTGSGSKPGITLGSLAIYENVSGRVLISGATRISSGLGINSTTTATGALGQDIGLAATVGHTIKGAASQTANLTEWQNSAGTVLAKVEADGRLTAAGIVSAARLTAEEELYLTSTSQGFIRMREQSSAPTGTADQVYLYAEDNGSGKTRLMAIFGSGAAQQIAIEP